LATRGSSLLTRQPLQLFFFSLVRFFIFFVLVQRKKEINKGKLNKKRVIKKLKNREKIPNARRKYPWDTSQK